MKFHFLRPDLADWIKEYNVAVKNSQCGPGLTVPSFGPYSPTTSGAGIPRQAGFSKDMDKLGTFGRKGSDWWMYSESCHVKTEKKLGDAQQQKNITENTY